MLAQAKGFGGDMAAHLMKTKKIDAVIVGCDRIAANGKELRKILS